MNVASSVSRTYFLFNNFSTIHQMALFFTGTNVKLLLSKYQNASWNSKRENRCLLAAEANLLFFLLRFRRKWRQYAICHEFTIPFGTHRHKLSNKRWRFARIYTTTKKKKKRKKKLSEKRVRFRLERCLASWRLDKSTKKK